MAHRDMRSESRDVFVHNRFLWPPTGSGRMSELGLRGVYSSPRSSGKAKRDGDLLMGRGGIAAVHVEHEELAVEVRLAGLERAVPRGRHVVVHRVPPAVTRNGRLDEPISADGPLRNKDGEVTRFPAGVTLQL